MWKWLIEIIKAVEIDMSFNASGVELAAIFRTLGRREETDEEFYYKQQQRYMEMATAEQVKIVRERSGMGMMECNSALDEANGDIEGALDVLRTRTASVTVSPTRLANEGLIHSYVHTNGKVAAIVEVNCTTDFVAKSDEFKELAHNIALQITAAGPQWVSQEEVPQDIIDHEASIYVAQAAAAGKPEAIQTKIAEGKLKKFLSESCLLSQKSIKDDKKTIQSMISELSAKVGEPIIVRRFERYQLGVN